VCVALRSIIHAPVRQATSFSGSDRDGYGRHTGADSAPPPEKKWGRTSSVSFPTARPGPNEGTKRAVQASGRSGHSHPGHPHPNSDQSMRGSKRRVIAGEIVKTGDQRIPSQGFELRLRLPNLLPAICARLFQDHSGYAGPPWDLPCEVGRRVRCRSGLGRDGTIRPPLNRLFLLPATGLTLRTRSWSHARTVFSP
jgi:hypothetical protein